MKKLPKVAILGKRNAGKSSLFNHYLGKHRALTDDFSGLTRDVLTAEINRRGRRFELLDLPGLDLPVEEELTDLILANARGIIEQAELLLVLLEGQPTRFEIELIDKFRKTESRPVVYALNKVDNPGDEAQALEDYYRLGIKDIIAISVKSRYHLGELMDLILEKISVVAAREELPKTSSIVSSSHICDITIAIAGKPNAGKSSLLNSLASKELALVSEIPGTTRDAIDTVFQWRQKSIRIIDTAGIRRARFLKTQKARAESLSLSRTNRAIQASDVVVLLLDASVPFSDQDKKIAALVVKYRKPCVIAFNKWDAVERSQNTLREATADFKARFPAMAHAPLQFISARTGQRLHALLESCFQLKERIDLRVPAPALNKLVQLWSKQGKTGKIMYATQAEKPPPAFVFFVKDKKSFRVEHLRFMENKLRAEYELSGIPIQLLLREQKE